MGFLVIEIGESLVGTAIAGIGIGVDNILLETGDNLLQEDGVAVFLLE